ncbi:MAG TPA: tetratricopeptide repeat protein [Burkholderiales bacterium]
MRAQLALALAVALAACARVPAPSAPETAPPPVASQNSAVIALVTSAREHASAGSLSTAVAELERALRIEPRNAALWHELARLTLHQGQPSQAAQFAQKSNTLAGNDTRLRAANWRLIGQARTQSGDHAGAEFAFQKAAELEREL